nr:hypothetical protein [Tanacetum cinerariifolium]
VIFLIVLHGGYFESLEGRISSVIHESDSDDEEEYQIKRNKFGAPIYGLKHAPYLNCNDPAKGSLAIQTVTNPFQKISVKKKGLWEQMMMRPDHHHPNDLENMKPWKRYFFHKFTMSSCYGKDLTEMQSLGYVKLDQLKRYLLRWLGLQLLISTNQFMQSCHEFDLTYEFDEVCADDELKTKKIIMFRLGGRGLRSDEHFNAQDYWLSISQEESLGLSRSHTSTIKKPILKLLSIFDARHQNGYANVAWLIARWMKRKGAGTQKESQICCGQFISKIAKKRKVLTEDVIAKKRKVLTEDVYDQYYQQYPPPPLQYQQQQQQDDDE